MKPADGRKGQKVYVGVRDLPSFVSAFTAVARASDQVLIEESVPGAVYRAGPDELRRRAEARAQRGDLATQAVVLGREARLGQRSMGGCHAMLSP